MAVQVRMPKLGMMEGDLQLVEWKKKEGDSVNKGDVLATVESQKITNDVEASVSGTVLKIFVQEGETAPIGAMIAVLGDLGEDITALQPAASHPRAVNEQSVGAGPVPAVSSDSDWDEEIVRASSAARKLAKQHGIPISDVAAALGTSKRLQREDVQRYIDETANKASGSDGAYTETKLLGMRKTIAERMGQSSRETAPVVLMRSVDITALKALREKKKSGSPNREKIPSFNDVIIKAVAVALESHPRLNATFENDTIRTYADININMAVAVEAGLVTPVVRNANKLHLTEISAKAKDLAERANSGTLSAEDMSEGTFTVTNLGMLGIEVSTPILNPPQVAILAVGTIQPYLILANGQVEERYKTFFSLTLDHRIVDGYPGAQYLYTLEEILQQPERLWD
ncbi:MAG: 2-oxo acid dehydrogenase subunit E2 [Synergistaceae bacterium]|jgi:pyruvate dehydrogenase E2 component (dihydrolipoamide acetyltransferase)|nr:2-oxo acid dehydrogenase subunit E2 [Synergistaceae bacterium]